MKHQTHTKKTKTILTGSALVLAATASVFAQQTPFSLPGTGQPPVPPAPPKAASVASTNAPAQPPGTNAVANFFENKIPEALAKGKFNLDVRLRYEQANQTSLADESYAPTIRTRFGYTTAPIYGFKAMIEGVNVTSLIRDENYNAAGSNGQGTRPPVADPQLTKLGQAWIAYNYTNLFSAKLGQQVINLDNQRFVGNVGWRQNMQTFDAITLGSEPVKGLNLSYSYIWDVHRVFGNVDKLPNAFTDFDSRSHLVNVSYSGWEYGRFVGYSYLLDLRNAAGNNNSCATYGGYFAGQAPVSDKVSVNYRAEYAYQTDYAKSSLKYGANYYNIEAGVNVKPFAFGGGYEVLGSDNNQGFRTPLATLHAFNGWADVFLNTPAKGLRDAYAYAQVTVPAINVPVRFVYHKFNADQGNGDFGQEFDVVASRKFGKNWNAMIKYACYNGQDAPAAFSANKFWAQVEFTF
jgi:hypothetical protein